MNEDTFRFLAENSNDFITVLDNKGRIKYLNNNHLKIGINPKRLTGSNLDEYANQVDDYIHPADKEQLFSEINKLSNNRLKNLKPRINFRIKSLTKNEYISLKSKIKIIDDEILLISKDVTKQISLEKQLRTLNQVIINASEKTSLPSLLNSVLESTIKLNNFSAGKAYIIDWGKGVAEIKASTQGFVEEFNLLNIYKKPYDKVFIKGESLVKNHPGEVNSITSPIPHQEGVIGAINITYNEPFTLEDKRIIEAIGKGVSHSVIRIIYEERVSKAKSKLINTWSHEMKTPLVPVFGYLQIIRNCMVEDEPVYNHISLHECELMIYEIKSFLHQVNNLVEYSNFELKRFELNNDFQNIKQVLNDACNDLSYLIDDKGINLSLKVKPKSLYLDYSRTKLVLKNVLHNAVKYLPPRLDEPVIKIKSNESRDNYCLKIMDNGMGLTEKELNNCLKEGLNLGFFEQERKRNIRGLKIGLKVSKKIMLEQEGDLLFNSPGRGEGLTTTIAFPLKRGLKEKKPYKN